jgi:hypothetical protein
MLVTAAVEPGYSQPRIPPGGNVVVTITGVI